MWFGDDRGRAKVGSAWLSVDVTPHNPLCCEDREPLDGATLASLSLLPRRGRYR